MMEKIPHAIGNYIRLLKCSFGICYGISRKYLPICVSVLVSDRNQNSGFGRTLDVGIFPPISNPYPLMSASVFTYNSREKSRQIFIEMILQKKNPTI